MLRLAAKTNHPKGSSMAKIVHKYEVNGAVIDMPLGARIISVGFQGTPGMHGLDTALYVWAMFDVAEKRTEPRYITAHGTGDASIPDDATHIGTAMTTYGGRHLVLHVYERGRIFN
ncbi:hypothetical protein [Pantoea phage Nafs113]|nr:hypothetical protein [Pantoea phage Nafs113]